MKSPMKTTYCEDIDVVSYLADHMGFLTDMIFEVPLTVELRSHSLFVLKYVAYNF
jgi:hypothetical protein